MTRLVRVIHLPYEWIARINRAMTNKKFWIPAFAGMTGSELLRCAYKAYK